MKQWLVDERRLIALETQEKPGQLLEFINYGSLSSNMAAGADVCAASINRALTLRRFDIAVYVATTNNGTNYWTITLKKADGTTLATLTTAAISANTWTVLSSSGLSASLTTATAMVYVQTSKTLSPGNLSLAGPVVECVR